MVEVMQYKREEAALASGLHRASPSVRFAAEVRRLMGTTEGCDARGRQLSGDLALPGIHIPEQYGGAGFSMVELCIALGRSLVAHYFARAISPRGAPRLTPF